MQIKATPSFLKRPNRIFKKNTPNLRDKFKQTVERLVANPFDPVLKTHKLTGDLKDFWSCSVTYKIRLRFKIIGDTIELLDMGTHDEIY